MSRDNKRFSNPLPERWFHTTDPSALDLILRSELGELLYLPKKWM